MVIKELVDYNQWSISYTNILFWKCDVVWDEHALCFLR